MCAREGSLARLSAWQLSGRRGLAGLVPAEELVVFVVAAVAAAEFAVAGDELNTSEPLRMPEAVVVRSCRKRACTVGAGAQRRILGYSSVIGSGQFVVCTRRLV